MQKMPPNSGKHKLKISLDEGYAIVRFIGNIEDPGIASNETVKMAIRTSRRILIIDLTKCYSLHPNSLKWLEQLSAYADCVDVRVRIIAPKGTKVFRLLKLMRYDRFMSINEDLEEALSYNKNLNFKEKSRFIK